MLIAIIQHKVAYQFFEIFAEGKLTPIKVSVNFEGSSKVAKDKNVRF